MCSSRRLEKIVTALTQQKKSRRTRLLSSNRKFPLLSKSKTMHRSNKNSFRVEATR